MSDTTAVVLTIGEEYTARAIDSVMRQSVPPEEIIRVENVAPFHKAINLGASRVKTEFCVQVDADMILDDCCFASLRSCMEPSVGIVVGHLRDPLVERACGVKMFRRACFDRVSFKDTISPDTDFSADIQRHDWSTIYALRFGDQADPSLWHTFGKHEPDYTGSYTFTKHLLQGRRYRYRQDLEGLRWHMGQLARSRHSVSLLAEIALAHGFFLEGNQDLLRPDSVSEDSKPLERFLDGGGRCQVQNIESGRFSSRRPRTVFEEAYKLGNELRRQGASRTFKSYMDALNRGVLPWAWIAKIGLCHGLLADDHKRVLFETEYRLLAEQLPRQGLGGIIGTKRARVLRPAQRLAGALLLRRRQTP